MGDRMRPNLGIFTLHITVAFTGLSIMVSCAIQMTTLYTNEPLRSTLLFIIAFITSLLTIVEYKEAKRALMEDNKK